MAVTAEVGDSAWVNDIRIVKRQQIGHGAIVGAAGIGSER